MRQRIPWQGKIAAKLVLSRIPVSYRNWASLGLFKHGAMADPAYAEKIFNLHLKEAFGENGPAKGLTFLEMGTGDSAASAVLAAAWGAAHTYLLDVGNFATKDMDFYRALPGTKLDDIPDFTSLLEACHADYLTEGLRSFKTLPDNSVDYAWSHATLEHVRKSEFDETMAELYRVMKPGGIVSHNIDFKDHLGGALNNLRFREKTWEAEWMASSGFYTNRLRPFEMLDSFGKAGFIIERMAKGKWDTLPTPRIRMAVPFCDQPEDELLTRSMSVLLKKPL